MLKKILLILSFLVLMTCGDDTPTNNKPTSQLIEGAEPTVEFAKIWLKENDYKKLNIYI